MNPAISQHWRGTLLGLIAVAAIVVTALHAPIPQWESYHQFADQRTLLGIPHFWNVASNLPFLLVGVLGLHALIGRRPPGLLPMLRVPYFIVFAGVALVAVGSGYYHLSPSNATLVWDRLPMTICFMAFVAIVIGEHFNERFGLQMLAPLLLVGIASVAYWAWTDDLRLYALVQFLPMLLIPLVLLLYPSRFSSTRLLWAMIGMYGFAKLLEAIDAPLYSIGEIMSGHALKHVAGAIAMYFLVLAVERRQLA